MKEDELKRMGIDWGIDKNGNRRYMIPKWTKHYEYSSKDGFYNRKPKLYWKPLQWLGNRPIFRYGIDRVIDLFIPWNGKTLKERWNFWGGGGKVNWWIRKNITHD